MGLVTSGLGKGLGNWRRSLVVVGLGLVFLGLLNLAGCPAPAYPQMFPDVTLADIKKITTDGTLSTETKKQRLTDLGITDEQVRYFLTNAFPPEEPST